MHIISTRLDGTYRIAAWCCLRYACMGRSKAFQPIESHYSHKMPIECLSHKYIDNTYITNSDSLSHLPVRGLIKAVWISHFVASTRSRDGFGIIISEWQWSFQQPNWPCHFCTSVCAAGGLHKLSKSLQAADSVP